MITSNVIITIIICITVLLSIFIICYFNNDIESKTKLKNIMHVIGVFREFHVTREKLPTDDKYIYVSNASSEEIMNLICTIEHII